MALSLILSVSGTSDSTVHIPVELFVALIIILITSFIGFLTWLTKQVISMGGIMRDMQSSQAAQAHDIEKLFRERR